VIGGKGLATALTRLSVFEKLQNFLKKETQAIAARRRRLLFKRACKNMRGVFLEILSVP
jgi:hypothetical protein